MENQECRNNPDQPEQLYFVIGVTCKHYHATDSEDSTVEFTILLMNSSAVVIKIVAHTQTGRIVSSGVTTDTVAKHLSEHFLLLLAALPVRHWRVNNGGHEPGNLEKIVSLN